MDAGAAASQRAAGSARIQSRPQLTASTSHPHDTGGNLCCVFTGSKRHVYLLLAEQSSRQTRTKRVPQQLGAPAEPSQRLAEAALQQPGCDVVSVCREQTPRLKGHDEDKHTPGRVWGGNVWREVFSWGVNPSCVSTASHQFVFTLWTVSSSHI